jgi:hypothetical protein
MALVSRLKGHMSRLGGAPISDLQDVASSCPIRIVGARAHNLLIGTLCQGLQGVDCGPSPRRQDYPWERICDNVHCSRAGTRLL